MPDSSFNPAVDCFALLDDREASDSNPRSRLYTSYIATLTCESAETLPALLEEMQLALGEGHHAVGLFTYEFGEQLHGIEADPLPHPLAQVMLFGQCAHLSAQEVEHWLASHDGGTPVAGVTRIRPDITEDGFAAAIERIHAYIEAGDTYQINYTYRLRFDAYGSPVALYRRLRSRQAVPYGALIALPDGRTVLSLSPELFIRHVQGMLTAQPMKGTAAASGDAQTDAARAAALAADPKNRAENLMIVDLLRNDLGRVAQLGSVEVPKLFHVDRYSSVLQMTSTVQARLQNEASLADIFTALYPCGSITGAPKRRAMQIIRELENSPRGIYTGAIGWFDAPRDNARVGDFCLSVPIRTLMLQAAQSDGIRKGEMGVGAGIVHDSKATEEFAECGLKAGFLTGLTHEFELFETMHATAEEGCRHLELHLQRLRASAAYFGFAYEDASIRAKLSSARQSLVPGQAYRLRLTLKQNGECTIQAAPITTLITPVKVLLAPHRTKSGDLFLRHKTTVRTCYDAAWKSAEAQGAFDMLFFNEDGELTEGGRSNVFLKLDGRWYTPPLSAGLLPGVMRAVLLADTAWDASERSMNIDDLHRAEQIVVCNALRGALTATLVGD